MEEAETITQHRLEIWQRYHDALEPLELAGKLRRPVVPADCQHNAHMYYILLASLEKRTELIASLKEKDINAVFHYVPLHSSPAGRKHGRVSGKMTNTENLSDQLLRLPLWVGLGDMHDEQYYKTIVKATLALSKDGRQASAS